MQERYRTNLTPHAEHISAFKLKRAGGNEILDGKAGRGQPVPRKAKWLRRVHAEDVVQEPQTVGTVQRCGCHAEVFKIVQNVDLDAFQTGLGRFQAVRFDAESQVLGFDEAVVAFGKLVPEHIRVLRAQAVEIVALRLDGDAFRKAVPRRGEVQERELKFNRAVEIVEKIAPALKNGGLVLVLVELIVDVLKLNGFRVIAVGHTADAVREHALKRNAVLRRLLFLISLPCPCDGSFDLTPLGARQ